MGRPVMALRFARGFSSTGLLLRIFPLGIGFLGVLFPFISGRFCWQVKQKVGAKIVTPPKGSSHTPS